MQKVSIIIPTISGREDLLNRLIKSIPKDYEIIIVDDEDMLLAAKRNKGAIKANGEYLLFVDDDNYFEDGAIENALELCEEEGVGIVGFMACYDDKKNLIADGGSYRNYITGFTRGLNTNEDWHYIPHEEYPVDEIANCFMIHSELFYELNGFDQENFPIDLDEADLCKRVKNLGLEILMCPLAKCYHKSQTYSPIPNFRRPMNAYFMGRNRQVYQRVHNTNMGYYTYLVLFMPVFVCFYILSLLSKKNPGMIIHFIKGVCDGLQGRIENKYTKR